MIIYLIFPHFIPVGPSYASDAGPDAKPCSLSTIVPISTGALAALAATLKRF